MEEMKKDISRLNTESIEYKRRLGILEQESDKIRTDVTNLMMGHAETKVYVTQILASIKDLDTKMLTFLTNLTANQKEENKGWRAWGLDIVKLTIAVAIGYFVFGGGVLK